MPAEKAPRRRPASEARLVPITHSPSNLGSVSEIQGYLVSSSGQMSLPAAARHRWDLDGGGPVDVLDLGFGVLAVPRGEGKRLLNDLLGRAEHAEQVRALGDDP